MKNKKELIDKDYIEKEQIGKGRQPEEKIKEAIVEDEKEGKNKKEL